MAASDFTAVLLIDCDIALNQSDALLARAEDNLGVSSDLLARSAECLAKSRAVLARPPPIDPPKHRVAPHGRRPATTPHAADAPPGVPASRPFPGPALGSRNEKP